MNEEKRADEGEMGSGDSDDEFYNVKLPCTPSVPACTATEKVEVKKIYSPTRTKVKYDYKFDSSSDDESETIYNGWKETQGKNQMISNINEGVKKSTDEERKSLKTAANLPQSTYKVVQKINEELRNAKKFGKTMKEQQENSIAKPNCPSTSLPSPGNVPRSQVGLLSPVVVMPPPMIVPQPPIMNLNQMMVPSPNLIPRHMLGMAGNLLRASPPMGGIGANPSSSIPNTMIAMNTVHNQMGGMMGVQNNIIGLSGNGLPRPGNVLEMQANMAAQKNMLGMAGVTGSGMYNIQQTNCSAMGGQSESGSENNAIGMSGPMNIARSSGSIIRTQNLKNSGGLVVNPGCVLNNPSGMMVVGGVMNTLGTSGSSGSTQGTVVSNPINFRLNNNMISVGDKPQIKRTVTSVPPPPPFLGIGNTPTSVGNLKWQSNVQNSEILMNAVGSSAVLGSLDHKNSPSASSMLDNSYEVDDYYSENKEKLKSDATPSLEKWESQSSSLSPNPSRDLANTFKNDGSFMEVFKKMKGEKNLKTSSNSECGESKEKSCSSVRTPPVILSGIVGKRRGGRVLKTGLVKKVKKEGDADDEKRPKDAWSMYMAEVKKYREASCEEEGKTRPLVK